MNRLIRASVGVLTLSQVFVGVWAFFFPAGFFALDVVGMGMAYNEHLMRDYGAMTLASAVVLGSAVVHSRRSLTQVALAMYLVWSVLHCVVHLPLLDHLTPPAAAFLITALAFAVALPVTLLVLTTRDRAKLSS